MSFVLDRAKFVTIAVIAGLLFIFSPAVLANSLPQSTLWLEFDDQTAEQPQLEGVQLIGCNDSGCTSPTLIDQHGRCNVAGCLDDTSPSVTAAQNLRCLADRCVLVYHYLQLDPGEPSFFRVVAQFTDRVRESNVFPYRLDYGGHYGWRIAVQDTVLSVSSYDPGLPETYPLANGFFQSFLLTAAVELLVAALALRGWLEMAGRGLLRGLGYVLLANLVSYLVTWTFWPSLRQFEPIQSRITGFFTLLLAGMFTALIANLSGKEGESRRSRMIITLILLPVTGVAIFLCWLAADFASVYGAKPIAVPGFPAGLTVALAEIFAVAFEALLLYLLARRTLGLALKQAGVISLAMNATSFVLSLVIFALL